MITCANLHPLSSILCYVPFLYPLPIWDYWYLLLIPLSAAVAVVYKSLKLANMRDVPRQAFAITLWILVGMSAGAAGLALIVWIVEVMRRA
jgi:hypothetical protein